jgi:SOS-response transcriptional repressor LexA
MNKSTNISNVLRQFGEKNFSSMSAFARALGMRPTDLHKYYRDKNPLPIGATMRERLASVGLTSEFIEEQIAGGETKINLPRVALVQLPVYQSVSAGTKGNLIMEDIVEYIAVPKSGDDTRFGVIVKGNSMSPRINPGDIVIVSEKQEVRNGDLAIVNWIDGEFNLRVVTFSGDNVVLTSENQSKYPPVIVAKENIHRLLRVVLRIEKF